MSITVHEDVLQRSKEWFALRCGIITASDMASIITQKTMAFAQNDTMRKLAFEKAAQLITGEVEEGYVSFDMQRGIDDEMFAREDYANAFGRVDQVGFITREFEGFKIGYSPDGLFEDDGLIEIKSRLPKHQVDMFVNGSIPFEHMIQMQTGLLVSGRKWCDYVSYCGGMPLYIKRVFPIESTQFAVFKAAQYFSEYVAEIIDTYRKAVDQLSPRIETTKRTLEIV